MLDLGVQLIDRLYRQGLGVQSPPPDTHAHKMPSCLFPVKLTFADEGICILSVLQIHASECPQGSANDLGVASFANSTWTL